MSSVIARRYAQAVMNLAVKGQQVDPVAAGLDDVADALEGTESLRQFVADPQVPLAHKESVMAELLARLSVPTVVEHFVRLVTRKRRAALLPEMRRHFHQLADERMGRGHAEVAVASELEPAQQDAVRQRLEALSGKQLTLHVTVDPSLLGGMVARIGSTVWDGSLRNQLTRIHHSIIEG